MFPDIQPMTEAKSNTRKWDFSLCCDSYQEATGSVARHPPPCISQAYLLQYSKYIRHFCVHSLALKLELGRRGAKPETWNPPAAHTDLLF